MPKIVTQKTPDLYLIGTLVVAGAIPYEAAKVLVDSYEKRDFDHVVPFDLDSAIELAITCAQEYFEGEDIAEDTPPSAPSGSKPEEFVGVEDPPFWFLRAYAMWNIVRGAVDNG